MPFFETISLPNMPDLVRLPTEIICNIIGHLDSASVVCFAVASKTTFDRVQMSFHDVSLSTHAPSLPTARITDLRHKYGNDLGCVNHWMITYLATSDISTSDWQAAYHSFQTLVASEGCEVCNHALFKYRMRECMGPDWSLCPDRLKFYRRARRSRHRCNMRNACLAESWRTLVPKAVVKRKQPSLVEDPEPKRQKCNEDDEAKVDANQIRDEVRVNQDQNSRQAESKVSSMVTVRRSQRLIAAAKSPEHRRQHRKSRF